MHGQVLFTQNLISNADEVDLPKAVGKKLTFKELQVTCTCACLGNFYINVVRFLQKHIFYWKLCYMHPWQHSAAPKGILSIHAHNYVHNL